MTDLLVQTRARLASEAAMRQALIARYEARQARESITPDPEYLALTDQHIQLGRLHEMRLSDERDISRKAHYRGAWLARLHGAPSEARESCRLALNAQGGMSASSITRKALTSEARNVMRLLMDDSARQANPRIALMESGEDVREPHRKGEAWKGLVNGTEARLSERGASGIKGVRGVAARVSIRDAHAATMSDEYGLAATTLRALLTVGVSPMLASLGLDVSECLTQARKAPRKATLTVRQSRVPFAVWAKGDHLSIRLASDYGDVRDARKAEARKAHGVRSRAEHEAMRQTTRDGRESTAMSKSELLMSLGSSPELATGDA